MFQWLYIVFLLDAEFFEVLFAGDDTHIIFASSDDKLIPTATDDNMVIFSQDNLRVAGHGALDVHVTKDIADAMHHVVVEHCDGAVSRREDLIANALDSDDRLFEGEDNVFHKAHRLIVSGIGELNGLVDQDGDDTKADDECNHLNDAWLRLISVDGLDCLPPSVREV